MKFTKVQSIGNDFVLVHLDDVHEDLLPELARKTSDRHLSIGSDGLLAIGRASGNLVLRMFNTDGSEDFCGNGLRCAALYAFRLGWTGRDAELCHFGRLVRTMVLDGDVVRSALEPPDFSPSSVPTNAPSELYNASLDVLGRTVTLSAVTTGSTHTVIQAGKLPEDAEFFCLGPAIENHPLFPERTSVIWAVPEGSDSLRIRIWERGVGETQGCGTGSAAAAAVWLRSHPEPRSLCVINPGGMVRVCMSGFGAPTITEAVAELLYKAELPGSPVLA